ncbi:MAG: hypothetical protein QXE64_00190 [Candidatus Pacearchaeota archaeon]
MSEKELIYETKVKHDGIFDFKALYAFLYDWFADREYFIKEESYTEKIKAEGKEIEIKWKCLKKITDYFRFEIEIKWRISRLVDIEITKEGKKIKANKGEVEIKFSGTLERDYENKFETSAFTKFLRSVYDRYIIRTRIEQMEGELTKEVIDASNQVKSYLVLEAKR